MAYTAIRKALIGGDFNTWGAFQQGMDKLHIGANTIQAAISGTDLTLGIGMIGISDGAQDWNVSHSTLDIISVAGLTASCWAKIEIAVVAGVPVITILSIPGETSITTIPTSFSAAYNGLKGGFYITSTKRCHSLVWINVAGIPTIAINTTGGKNEYTSLPQTEAPYAEFNFEENVNTYGGAVTTGAWLKLTDTAGSATQKQNTITGLSISAGVFTIPKGTYEIDAWHFFVGCDHTTIRLLDLTNSVTLLVGSAIDCSSTYSASNSAILKGRITLTTQITMELEYNCGKTFNIGLGVPGNHTEKEVYGQIIFRKIG